MTSSYSEKITKLKNALENVFVKKTDIKNNLTSTDINKPLSANQGKILDTNKVDKISGKSLSTNDFTNTYKTKLDNLDTLLENKANNTHTHGNLQNDGSIGTSNNVNKNVITDANGKITTEDKPTIPTKTSDLTNDGDGSNVFVKDNDSRLTNSRTPTSHSHGNITNNGRVTVGYDTIIPGPALIADNNDDGTLKDLTWTEGSTYKQTLEAGKTYKFVIKSSYSIFKGNQSDGLIINVKTNTDSNISDIIENDDTDLD